MKVVIHFGKTEKEWKYNYIPNVGEDIITKTTSFKVLKKAYNPKEDTLHINLKKIEAKAKETVSIDVVALFEIQREELIKQIEPFQEEYGNEMCQFFYEYWTEKIVKGGLSGQCRYVAEKTWSIKKRLNTWKSNNFNKK